MNKQVSLQQILDGMQGVNGRYHGDIPDSWAQGRTSLGGLIVGMAVRAARLHGAARPLRSILVSFIAPIYKSCELVVQELRHGSSVSQYAVEVLHEGRPACHVSLVYGESREAKRLIPPARDDLPAQDAFPVVEWPLAFTQYFEMRFRGDGIPMSGSGDCSIGGWFRLKETGSVLIAEGLPVIADLTPPIMMSHYDTPVNGSSVTWKLEYLVDSDQEMPALFWLEDRLEFAQHGYSIQRGHVYDAHGQLLAISDQCMAYFEVKAR